jgi:glycine/D-amino acid oxidase-like deaminating enzyme/nitrite reductase/ring-hydroxylating ferredoxin subunit
VPVPPWLDGPLAPERSALDRDLEVDVAVVGGGIVGLTAALLLRRSGARVAVLEGRRIGTGVTGQNTAKLTSLHGLTYERLVSRFGSETARSYAASNEAGIALVWRLAEELSIDCDLRRKPNYTYTESAPLRDKIEAEVSAAVSSGLPASYTEETDLPFPVVAAIRVEEQAEFHPYRYARGLADALSAEGALLFERSVAVGVADGAVRTSTGSGVGAERVIVATHIPFLDRGLYFARTHPERSYAIGARLGGPTPQGMYLSAESPTRSLRAHPMEDGELWIVGGEGHPVGQGKEHERYRRLEAYAHERFDVERIDYRWSAQDNMPVDGLPFVGRLVPFSDRILVATGFRKWGLAMGSAAGQMLADMALGKKNPWADALNPARFNPLPSARELLWHNARVGFHFLGDRVVKRSDTDSIGRGEGRIVGSGMGQAAVHREEDGKLHGVSARCTHLGCIVNWNSAERSWDCPCHGSRFAPTGEVIQGPATAPLVRRGSFEREGRG